MLYRFAEFELDLAAVELRAGGEPVRLEPQVFALLALLVANGERLVSKDEIIEKVWDGRVVSDAAVASRVKSARHALGDNGTEQKLIKTIHGQGYRFVGEARAARSGAGALAADSERDSLAGFVQGLERVSRPSLAVLPFRYVGTDARYAPLATALPDELIAELARLRWLFVTARGSSFRLRVPEADFGDIGRLLRVRYCLWGTIELTAQQLAVTVELVDTNDGGIVWADRFAGRLDDVHALREQIAAARWAERGARSPGAHVLIALIAAAVHALTGNTARAAFWAGNVRDRNAALTRQDFFRAFPIRSGAMRAQFERGLAQLGF